MGFPRPSPSPVIGLHPQGTGGNAANGQQPLGPGSSPRFGRAIRVNVGFQVGPAASDNTVVQVPAYRVPLGCKLTLLAPNSNAGLAIAGESRSAVSQGIGDIVPNVTPIDYPVDNTASVWVLLAKAGDYVSARVVNDVTL